MKQSGFTYSRFLFGFGVLVLASGTVYAEDPAATPAAGQPVGTIVAVDTASRVPTSVAARFSGILAAEKSVVLERGDQRSLSTSTGAISVPPAAGGVPDLLPLSTVGGVRSESFLAKLSAGEATPTLAMPAAPQAATSADSPRLSGWVKAAIVVGSIVGGVAIWRAIDGEDEDLAPFPN